jgi:photosystem II stability/assembly factor-like uncharacterized protein
MKRFSLALVIIACYVSVFYGQATTFKAKQKEAVSPPKKAVRLNKKKAVRSDAPNQGSIIRNTDLNVISAIKGGDVFIGGHGTSFEGEKIRGYGLLVKISSGEIAFKELPFLSNIQHIFFLDNLTGWVTGYNGTYKTVDGGETWKKSEFSDVRDSLFFLDADNGWYFSHGGTLNRIKGEKVETLKDFEGFIHVKKLQFTNPERGWLRYVENRRNVFLQTKDGGKNWNPVNVGEDDPHDFQFINDYEGYVLAEGRLYYTSDGGENWQPVGKEAEKEWFGKLYFQDRNSGWITGQKDCFTNDGGISWKCTDSLKELKDKIIRGFVFTDTRNGWLLSEEGLYFTENGGNVWQRKLLSFDGGNF